MLFLEATNVSKEGPATNFSQNRPKGQKKDAKAKDGIAQDSGNRPIYRRRLPLGRNAWFCRIPRGVVSRAMPCQQHLDAAVTRAWVGIVAQRTSVTNCCSTFIHRLLGLQFPRQP